MAQRSVSHLNLAAIHNQNCRVGEELLALDDEAAVHRDRGEAVGGDRAAQCVRVLGSSHQHWCGLAAVDSQVMLVQKIAVKRFKSLNIGHQY